MVKKLTSMNLEHELIEKSRRMGLNMSQVAESAIREKLGHVQVEIDTTTKICAFCGTEGERETADEVKTRKERADGMTWLWPNEVWICNKCLNFKKKGVTAAKFR